MVRSGNRTDTETNAQWEDTVSRASSVSPVTHLLLAGGLLLGIAGVGLMGLPSFDRGHAWITTNAARHGIEGASIALTGVLLCGMWIASRARRDARKQEPKTADAALLLEQVASDVAQLRGGMQDLRVEFVYLKDMVQNAQARGEMMEADANDGPEAAIFRLAASMDQLSGRLEHRMTAQDDAVQQGMRALHEDMQATQAGICDIQTRIEIAGTTLVPTAADAGDGAPEREIEIEPGYSESEDDVHVYVELEEEPEHDLGLLDELDDFGTPHAHKTSPSIRPSIARERIEVDIGVDASPRSDLKAPLPASSPSPKPAAESLDEKLAQLRELMSDPLVRQALEETRRATPR